VIVRHALQERIIISSFNPLALKRFRDMLPNVPIGFLYSADVPVDTHQMMRELKLSHEARHPHHDLVDVDYMEWARKNGYWVNAWTVNDLERAVALRNLGVDAIITDKPIDLLRALRGE
jgi:glycerophosphoryl diester phosphodiesterase